MYAFILIFETEAEISQNICMYIQNTFLAGVWTAIQFSFVPIAHLEVIAYLQPTSRLTG